MKISSPSLLKYKSKVGLLDSAIVRCSPSCRCCYSSRWAKQLFPAFVGLEWVSTPRGRQHVRKATEEIERLRQWQQKRQMGGGGSSGNIAVAIVTEGRSQGRAESRGSMLGAVEMVEL